MFKKTFLAVAVGAALGATGANAAILNPASDDTFFGGPGTNDFTHEAAENLARFAVPDVNVKLNGEYQVDDEVTFTYNADVAGDFAQTILVSEADEADVEPFSMTLGLLSQTLTDGNTVVRYRVTDLTSESEESVDDSITTDNALLLLGAEPGSDLTISGDRGRATVTTPLTVALSSSTSDLAGEIIEFDDGISGNLIEFADQFTFADCDDEDFTSGVCFSKTIDTEIGVLGEDYVAATDYLSAGLRSTITNRSLFTDGTATDGATVGLTNNAAMMSRTAEVTEVRATLNGDWSFILENGGSMTAAMAGADSDTASYGPSSATFTWDDESGAPVIGDIAFSFDNTGGGAMDPGSMSVSVAVDYNPLQPTYTSVTGAFDNEEVNDDELKAPAGDGWSDSGNAGEWDIDYSSVEIYAVPSSGTSALFVWVTNKYDENTPYEVVATDRNGDSATVAGGVLGANSITTLGPEIIEGIAGSEVLDPSTGRVTLEVRTAAPACSINVYAGYKNIGDSDRLNLETSQTIQGVHNTGQSGVIDDQCSGNGPLAQEPAFNPLFGLD